MWKTKRGSWGKDEMMLRKHAKKKQNIKTEHGVTQTQKGESATLLE